MTRTEFDNQVREMKAKRAEALRPVMDMQRELREKIAAKNRTIAEIGAQVQKMKQQQSLLNAQNTRINDEHSVKIKAFIDEYESHTTSNLAEADTPNIVYELRRRGFYGMVQRQGDEPTSPRQTGRMTEEELKKVPFRETCHMAMEGEYTTTYMSKDGRLGFCDHVPRDKYGMVKKGGRAVRHFMIDGKVYKSKKKFLEALKNFNP